MIFSDCFGDCSKEEFDLIIRGEPYKVRHELMHILLSMKEEDVLEVFELWFKELKERLEEINE